VHVCAAFVESGRELDDTVGQIAACLGSLVTHGRSVICPALRKGGKLWPSFAEALGPCQGNAKSHSTVGRRGVASAFPALSRNESLSGARQSGTSCLRAMFRAATVCRPAPERRHTTTWIRSVKDECLSKINV
jgi:hypothetical protein